MLNKITLIRHSLSHILAHAVQELYPKAKFGIGPAIENGFYYDFDNLKISDSDLPKIEKKMKELIKKDLKFKKKKISKAEAKKIFKTQPFKLELTKDGPSELSVYESGDFTDLCKEPHIKSTLQLHSGQTKEVIDAFKLTKTAGAYWKGNEKNKMLTRIYGVAFNTKKELESYFKMQEEAEKRDHRKLGKELDLFCFSNIVGAGLPLYTPKGTTIIKLLEERLWEISKKFDVSRVSTPHLAKIDLYKISGHAEKFANELFHVKSHYKEQFVMKPVQCPHQTQIYASKVRSYRDLPIRYMETERQYRDEKPGEIGGLYRTRGFIIDDGHTFCTVEQVKQEVKILIKIIKSFYSSFGLWGKHWVSLSIRDKYQKKYIGEPKDWNKCEKMLQEISNELKLSAKKMKGEAALYGPKLDFMFKDALNREHQLATVQLDFATPKRFKLTYINEKGKKNTPVMVHRAILGSYERFIALLLEHFAGAFPLWLSPVQTWIIPIGNKHQKYAEEISKRFQVSGFRFQVINDNETLSKKIREGEKQKVPYLLIIGDKEIKNKTVSIRKRGKRDIGEMKTDKFIEKVQQEIEAKK